MTSKYLANKQMKQSTENDKSRDGLLLLIIGVFVLAIYRNSDRKICVTTLGSFLALGLIIYAAITTFYGKPKLTTFREIDNKRSSKQIGFEILFLKTQSALYRINAYLKRTWLYKPLKWFYVALKAICVYIGTLYIVFISCPEVEQFSKDYSYEQIILGWKSTFFIIVAPVILSICCVRKARRNAELEEYPLQDNEKSLLEVNCEDELKSEIGFNQLIQSEEKNKQLMPQISSSVLRSKSIRDLKPDCQEHIKDKHEVLFKKGNYNLTKAPFENRRIKNILSSCLPHKGEFADLIKMGEDKDVQPFSQSRFRIGDINKHRIKPQLEQSRSVTKRQSVTTFTPYSGLDAGLNEANRNLVRTFYEQDLLLHSFNCGVIHIDALDDKYFYFSYDYSDPYKNNQRRYRYSDYGKYYSVISNKEYGQNITSVIEQRNAAEDLYQFQIEIEKMVKLYTETFNLVACRDWNGFLQFGDEFAKYARAVSLKRHISGKPLLQTTLSHKDYKTAKQHIENFVARWTQVYHNNIYSSADSFDRRSSVLSDEAQIDSYYAYCAMHTFNEKYFECANLIRILPNEIVQPLKTTSEIIRDYAPDLILKEASTNQVFLNKLIRNVDSDVTRTGDIGEWVSKELAIIDSMNGFVFEEYCKNLLLNIGFSRAEKTPKSWDYGADVLAWYNNKKYAFQCKRHTNDIGENAVEEICRGKDYWNATIGIVITNRYFLANTIKLAEERGIVLWNRDVLRVLIAHRYKSPTFPGVLHLEELAE